MGQVQEAGDAAIDLEQLDSSLASSLEAWDFLAYRESLSDRFESWEKTGDLEGLKHWVKGVVEALGREAEKRPPKAALGLYLRMSRLQASLLEAPVEAAFSLAQAWKILPDEKVLDALCSWVLKEAAGKDYVWQALLAVGEGESQKTATRMLLKQALERRRYADAERYLQRLLEDAPDEEEFLGLQLKLKSLRDKNHALIKTLRLGLEGQQGQKEKALLYDQLGDALQSDGKKDEALEAWRVSAVLGRHEALQKMEGMLREGQELERLAEVWKALLPELKRPLQKELQQKLMLLLGRELGDASEAQHVMLSPEAPTLVPLAVEKALYYEGKARSAPLADKIPLYEQSLAALQPEHGSVTAIERRLWESIQAIDPSHLGALEFFLKLAYEEERLEDAYAVLRRLRSSVYTPKDIYAYSAALVEVATALYRQAEKGNEAPYFRRMVEAWRALEECLESLDLGVLGDAALPAPSPLAQAELEGPKEGLKTRVRKALRQIYVKSKEWHAYIQLIERELKDKEGDKKRKMELLFDMVEVYQNKDKLPLPSLVLQTYQRIVALSPHEAFALDQLVIGFQEREQKKELLEVLAKKVELADSSEELTRLFHQIAALYLDEINQEPEAIFVLEQLLELNPTDLELSQTLRRLYRRRARFEHLYGLLEKEWQLAELGVSQRQEEDILRDMAEVAENELLQPQRAIAHYEALLRLVGEDKPSMLALERLHAKQQDWPAYVRLLEERLLEAKDPDEAFKLKMSIGDLYLTRLKDAEKAEAFFRELRQKDPENEALRDYLQRIFVMRRKWHALERLFQREEGKPETLVWEDYEGFLKAALAEVDEGVEGLKEELYCQLANLHQFQMGDPEGALFYLEKALQLEPNVALAKRHNKLLPKDAPITRQRLSLDILAQHASDPLERFQSWVALLDFPLDENEVLSALGGALHAGTHVLIQSAKAKPLMPSPIPSAQWIDLVERMSHHWKEKGQWEASLFYLQESISLLPPLYEAERIALHGALGRVLGLHLGRWEEALRHLFWVMELDPKNEDAPAYIEDFYRHLGKAKELEHFYRKRLLGAASKAEKLRLLEKLLAFYKGEQANSSAYLELLEELVLLSPENKEAQDEYLAHLTRQKDHEKLAMALERALARASDKEEMKQLQLRLTLLYAQKLQLGEKALAHAHQLLTTLEASENADVIARLIAMAKTQLQDSNDVMAPLVLELAYRKTEQYGELYELLEARSENLRGEALSAVLDEMAVIAEVALQSKERALTVALKRLELSPEKESLWTELEQRARPLSAWEDVRELYERILASGRLSREKALALKERLARILSQHLFFLDEAIVLLEELLEEGQEGEGKLGILVELGELYKKNAELQKYVKVQIKAAQLSAPEERQSHLFLAAKVLSRALGQDERAMSLLAPILKARPASRDALQLALEIDESQEDWKAYERRLDEAIASLKEGQKEKEEKEGPFVDELALRRALMISRDPKRKADGSQALLALLDSEFLRHKVVGTLLDMCRSELFEAERGEILSALEGKMRRESDLEGLVATLIVKGDLGESAKERGEAFLDAALALAPALDGEAQERAPEDGAADGRPMDLLSHALLAYPKSPFRERVLSLMAALDEANGDVFLRIAPIREVAMALLEKAQTEEEGLSSALVLDGLALLDELDELPSDRSLKIEMWQEALHFLPAEDSEGRLWVLSALRRHYEEGGESEKLMALLEELLGLPLDEDEKINVFESLSSLSQAEAELSDAILWLQKAFAFWKDKKAQDAASKERITATLSSLLQREGRESERFDLLLELATYESELSLKTAFVYQAVDLAREALLPPEKMLQAFTYLEGEARDLHGEEELLAEALFQQGELYRTAFHDGREAFLRYLAVLELFFGHEGALQALEALEEDTKDEEDARAIRALLLSSYEETEDLAGQKRVLEKILESQDGDAIHDFELAGLYERSAGEEAKAWPLWIQAYEKELTGEIGLLAREKCLAWMAAHPERVDEGLSAFQRLSEGMEGQEREKRQLQDLEAFSAFLPQDERLLPLWKEVLLHEGMSRELFQAGKSLALAVHDEEFQLRLLKKGLALSLDEDDARLASEIHDLLLQMGDRDEEAKEILLPYYKDDAEARRRLMALLDRHHEGEEKRRLLERAFLELSTEDEAKVRPLQLLFGASLLEDDEGLEEGAALLGELLLLEGEEKAGALLALEKAWASGKHSAGILNALELEYHGQKEWEKLLALYEGAGRGGQADMDFYATERQTELLLGELKEPERAFSGLLAFFERTEEQEPEHDLTPLLETALSLLPSQDAPEKARAALKQRFEALHKQDEAQVFLLSALARFCEEDGDEKSALYFYELWVKEAPKDAVARRGLARHLEKKEAWTRLVELLEEDLRDEAVEAARLSLRERLATLYESQLLDKERALKHHLELEKASDLGEDKVERSRKWISTYYEELGLSDAHLAHLSEWIQAAEGKEDALALRLQRLKLWGMREGSEEDAVMELAALFEAWPERAELQNAAWALFSQWEEGLPYGRVPKAPFVKLLELLQEMGAKELPLPLRMRLDEAELQLVDDEGLQHAILLRLAQHAELAQNPKKAFAYLSEALHLQPDDEALRLQLEDRALALSLKSELSLLYRRILESPKVKDRVSYAIGIAERSAGDDEAVFWYEQAFLEDEHCERALSPLRAYYEAHRMAEKERRVLLPLLALSDDPALSYELTKRLAILEMDAFSRPQVAIRRFEEAMAFMPLDEDAGRRLERLYAEQEDFSKLRRFYEQGLLETQDQAKRLATLASLVQLLEQHEGDLETAKLHCETMLEISPHHDFAWKTLLRLTRKSGPIEDIDALLSRQLASQPSKEAQLAILIEKAFYARHDRDKALLSMRLLKEARALGSSLTLSKESIAHLEALLPYEAEIRNEAALLLAHTHQKKGAWEDATNTYLIAAFSAAIQEQAASYAMKALRVLEDAKAGRPLELMVLMAVLTRLPHAGELQKAIEDRLIDGESLALFEDLARTLETRQGQSLRVKAWIEKMRELGASRLSQ